MTNPGLGIITTPCTYAYEEGAGSITHLRWSDAANKFTHEGAEGWNGPDNALVEVVKR